MKFHVLTLFPEIPRAFFESSIMAKAVDKGIIAYDLVNIRDFAFDKHKTCDDSPYGGGAGMLMLPEPLNLALKSVFKNINSTQTADGKKPKKRVVYVTPSGKPFNQKIAQELIIPGILALHRAQDSFCFEQKNRAALVGNDIDQHRNIFKKGISLSKNPALFNMAEDSSVSPYIIT